MAQQYSLRTANFSGGKAFGILIDLKGYAHCIYLLLTDYDTPWKTKIYIRFSS